MAALVGWMKKKIGFDDGPKSKKAGKGEKVKKENNLKNNIGGEVKISNERGDGDKTENNYENECEEKVDEKKIALQNISDFLALKSKYIAKQLAFMDWNVLKQMKVEEFVNTDNWSESICKLTDNFEQIHYITLKTVLSGTDKKIRASIIKHFIKIAKHLFHMDSLNACGAIITALQYFAIARLDESWKRVPSAKMKLLKTLKALFSEKDNFLLLTNHMIKVHNRLIPVHDVNPFVPYLALILKDFETVTKKYSGFKIFSLRRINVLRYTLEKLENEKFDNEPISSDFGRFWESLKISLPEKMYLEEESCNISRQLEPPRRFYKPVNVSELSLDE